MTHEEAMAQAAKMVSDPEMQAEIAECLLAPEEPPLDDTDIEPKFAALVVWLLFWHGAVVCARLGLKRLFVWRDRPTWVVRFVATSVPPKSDIERQMVSQARHEMGVRAILAARKAKNA